MDCKKEINVNSGSVINKLKMGKVMKKLNLLMIMMAAFASVEILALNNVLTLKECIEGAKKKIDTFQSKSKGLDESVKEQESKLELLRIYFFQLIYKINLLELSITNSKLEVIMKKRILIDLNLLKNEVGRRHEEIIEKKKLNTIHYQEFLQFFNKNLWRVVNDPDDWNIIMDRFLKKSTDEIEKIETELNQKFNVKYRNIDELFYQETASFGKKALDSASRYAFNLGVSAYENYDDSKLQSVANNIFQGIK